MEQKPELTAQLLGKIEAQSALIEAMIVAMRNLGLTDDQGIDGIFAHARGQFAQPRMVASGGEAAHTALSLLEAMQTRVVGRARSMS